MQNIFVRQRSDIKINTFCLFEKKKYYIYCTIYDNKIIHI